VGQWLKRLHAFCTCTCHVPPPLGR
jgi:hypothetical protein